MTATGLDRLVVTVGFRLLGNTDAASLTETLFSDPPRAGLVGPRWGAIFYCWWAVVGASGLVWVGIWAALHTAGLAGHTTLMTGLGFFMCASLTAAFDASWRAMLSLNVSKRIRQIDRTQTALPLRLRIAEWNNHRLFLQLAGGVGAAICAAVLSH